MNISTQDTERSLAAAEARKEGLQKARERMAELKAQGLAPTPKDPIDKALEKPNPLRCLKAYLWDMHGIRQNSGIADADQGLSRKEALADFARLRKIGSRLAVNQICFNCAGGKESTTLAGERSSDGDESAKIVVRDCPITDCPLHPVRPWRSLKGKGRFSRPRPLPLRP